MFENIVQKDMNKFFNNFGKNKKKVRSPFDQESQLSLNAQYEIQISNGLNSPCTITKGHHEKWFVT